MVKCRPFLKQALVQFYIDAIFVWDDAPARLLQFDVLDKFPSLAEYCSDINWRYLASLSTFSYLTASVSAFYF